MAEHIFVYGTLKTGQCRESHWPTKPLQICNAWTLGRLYDTGPYPAMIRGEDRVAGQVWSFRESDLEQTLKVLDRIEGTNQPGAANDYDRCQVIANLASDEQLLADAYLFAKPQFLAQFSYLPPELNVDGTLYAIWPRHAAW